MKQFIFLKIKKFKISLKSYKRTTTITICLFLALFAYFFGLMIEPVYAAVKPANPTNLTVRTISPVQVNLSWTDASGDEEGFN